MVFTGTYEHTVDPKHRLAIPADLRAQIEKENQGAQSGQPVELVVTLTADRSLALYTLEDFDKRAQELDHSQLDPRLVLEYERVMFSLSRRVEIDKQGRVLLPENLLIRSGLGSEVVLIGAKDHLEIRDRKTWQEYIERVLDSKLEFLMNPRQAMRNPATPSSGAPGMPPLNG